MKWKQTKEMNKQRNEASGVSERERERAREAVGDRDSDSERGSAARYSSIERKSGGGVGGARSRRTRSTQHDTTHDVNRNTQKK